MSVSEFSLIERYFSTPFPERADVVLPIGDDAASVCLPPGHELLVSVDTLVSGVHFPEDTRPEDIGYKALAVNLSDMAAMGAEPAWATLALTLPDSEAAWLQSFSDGFFKLARRHNVALIGGDTTRGPLTISVQMMGYAPMGKTIKRTGAKVGDLVFVSGSLGDAGQGLALAQQRSALALSDEQQHYFLQRLNRPTPRLALGRALRGIASSAIDVSDGLLADLGHILDAGQLGACLSVENLPVSEALMQQERWWESPLSAGDDYELCFTVPPEKAAAVAKIGHEERIAVTCIGVIEEQPGTRLNFPDGSQEQVNNKGFKHFE